MKTLITTYRWAAAMLIMTITGSFSLVLVILSLGALRNFCSQYIITYSSRFTMRIMGFKSVFPPITAYPKNQVMYTFNHNSYIDVFLLTGLGIPNIRCILSEKTFGYIPVVISALAFGVYYIPQKKHAKRRLNFFIKLTEKLKTNNLSLIASAEGVHTHFHGIAPFNRGVFHMALEAKLPIVPLFVHIPKENNMFKTEFAKNGTLTLEILPTIETSNWTLSNLNEHINSVRSVFVSRFNELNPDEPTV